MGEIADALKRARHDGDRRAKRSGAQTGGAPSRSPIADWASEPPRGAVAGRAHPGPPDLWPEEAENGTAAGGEASLARIPRSRRGSWRARAILVNPRRGAAQRYSHFALQLRRELQERDLRSVVITSALRGEGKTVTACNVSLALASMPTEDRVALVELDLRRPAISDGLGVRPRAGLERVLSGEIALSAARTPTEFSSLDLFVVERPVAAAQQLLSAPPLADVLAELGRRYATVVVDTPPALLVPDVILIMEHVGACIAVARAGTTRIAALRDILKALPAEKLIGVFVNEAPGPRHARQYTYYRDETKRDTDAG